jgi:hypothetical protein
MLVEVKVKPICIEELRVRRQKQGLSAGVTCFCLPASILSFCGQKLTEKASQPSKHSRV